MAGPDLAQARPETEGKRITSGWSRLNSILLSRENGPLAARHPPSHTYVNELRLKASSKPGVLHIVHRGPPLPAEIRCRDATVTQNSAGHFPLPVCRQSSSRPLKEIMWLSPREASAWKRHRTLCRRVSPNKPSVCLSPVPTEMKRCPPRLAPVPRPDPMLPFLCQS